MDSVNRTVEALYKKDSEIERLEEQLYGFIDEDGQVIDFEGIENLFQSIEEKAKDKEDYLLKVAHIFAVRKTRLAAVNDRLKALESVKKNIGQSITFFEELLKRFVPNETKEITDGSVIIKAGWRKKMMRNETVALSDDYMKPKYKDNPMVQNTPLIEKALKDGIDIPGCSLGNVRTISVK